MNTYMIKTSYLDEDMIKDVIELRGNWRPYNEKTDGLDVTFLYIDGEKLKAKDHYKYKTFIKTVVDNSKQSITNKEQLYVNFKNKYPDACKKYMLPQRIIKMDNYKEVSNNLFSEKTPQIIKAVFAGHGASLTILTSYEQYLKYIEDNKRQYGRNGWMLEPYIDTLMYSDRKFHIRAYFMYHEGKSYLFRWSRILLAKKKYVHGDWDDFDIHISHFNDQPHIQFPEDFATKFGQDKTDTVNDQMLEIAGYISGILHADCYKPDSVHCMEVFGVDFVITPDFEVKLLEANEYTSFAHNPDMKGFFKKFVQGIMQEVVDKLVPPLNKIEHNDYFIDVSADKIVGGYYQKYMKYKTKYKKLKTTYYAISNKQNP